MRRKKNELREELIFQIKGLLDIELGNIAYDNGFKLYYEVLSDCINIYVDVIESKEEVWNMCEIGHCHIEDLLYLILRFDREKAKMLNRLCDFIESKMEVK